MYRFIFHVIITKIFFNTGIILKSDNILSMYRDFYYIEETVSAECTAATTTNTIMLYCKDADELDSVTSDA